ncbi:MAG: DUF4251 domain-containing protein [Bacteroidaceae bacterium]|nr:DUF4251 domain-containing protein [Bacteroidaceae bacterium]
MKTIINNASRRGSTNSLATFANRALTLVLLLFTFAVGETIAQDKKMSRKEKEAAWRAERLRKRAAEERLEIHNDSIQYLQAISALKSGSWALEASNVSFNNGTTNFVTESTNFISVNNGTATVQTALNNSNAYSPNGLGGITLTGRIGNIEMSIDRYGNVYYNFGIFGSEISATVSVMLSAGSNRATATVDPNFSSLNMTMSGNIYSYNNAGIIEGITGY